MIIGIEAQRIFRKKKHGMDMVALELIRNLQKLDTVNEYVIFVRSDEENYLLNESPNFRIVEINKGFYPLWEQISLPRAAKTAGCAILHCTSNTAPVFSSVPVVITLHDIIYMEKSYLEILTGSGTWYQKLGNVYRRMVIPRIIGRSRKIITVSQFEEKRIARFFGMDKDKRLVSVYNGVGEHFMPVSDNARLIRVKEKYNLPDRFFFFLGNTDPKKNTRGTLQAFSDFVDMTENDICLVMLDYDRDELDKMIREIGNNKLLNRIVLTGYVANTDLPAIYSQSELFLYPSLRESFGLPMLEAMACGVPVITSCTSSMPEVAGDAALLIDPFIPREITEAMIQICENNSLRADLIQKGFIRAAKFSWKSMAQDVLKIYHEAVNID
jgi:glycosyltransferase involved in cell wall biosynthesis